MGNLQIGYGGGCVCKGVAELSSAFRIVQSSLLPCPFPPPLSLEGLSPHFPGKLLCTATVWLVREVESERGNCV